MRRPFASKPHNLCKKSHLFDYLPDDLLLLILCILSSSVSSPSDFLNVLLTCKRMNRLGLHRLVLSKAGPKMFVIKVTKWSEWAHRFLKQCVNAGNVDACYTLGMIRFYCLENRGCGLALMAKAAMRCHAPALYSLAVIQFNGSGGSKLDKDLRTGVALCARAALLGHIDALRELGHCLQDGYGVRKNLEEGRRLLVQANAREMAFVLRALATSALPSSSSTMSSSMTPHRSRYYHFASKTFVSPLPRDVGYNVGVPEVHPANWFLREWFALGCEQLGEGLSLCSHIGCGRPETRPQEFRHCSGCGKVKYCSRGCQVLDWKLRHKSECSSVAVEVEAEAAAEDGVGDSGVLGLNDENIQIVAIG